MVAAVRPRCILLVEDHAESLSALARLLEFGGYTVRRAATYHQAMNLADGCDLLVADIGLPDGNGLDLMRELSGLYGMRGVAVSGFAEPLDLQQAAAAGYCEYLVKPVKIGEVVEAIERASTMPPMIDGGAIDHSAFDRP